MAKWLHVSDRMLAKAQKADFSSFHSNESLRLQPPIPSGSQRSVNKGAGEKVLGKWCADTSVVLAVSDNSVRFVGSFRRKRRSSFTPTASNGTRKIFTLQRRSYHSGGSVQMHLLGRTTLLRLFRSRMDPRTAQGRILH